MSTPREDAARWFTRLLHLPPGHPDHHLFEQWRSAHPLHAAEYQAFCELWGDFSSTGRTQALASALERNTGRRRVLRGGLLGCTALLAVLSGAGYWSRFGRYEQRYSTAIGERAHHWLPDGSELYLNAATRLLVRYSAERRQVYLLDGEVIFDVARAAQRPFVIDAGEATITVLGTRFVVNRFGDRVRVSVEHGRVQVDSAHGQLLLGAGEVAQVRAGQALQRLPISARDAFAFEHGSLVFDKADLTEIATRLSRYTRLPVRSLPGTASPRVTAVVQLATVESFVQALPSIAAVQVNLGTGETLIRPRESDKK